MPSTQDAISLRLWTSCTPLSDMEDPCTGLTDKVDHLSKETGILNHVAEITGEGRIKRTCSHSSFLLLFARSFIQR